MKLLYLISSHAGYQAALDRLLANIPAGADVVSVVGGCPDRAVSASRILVPHNSFDYTALIDFVEHPEDYPACSHVFLLHDTMEMGADADRLICAADASLDAVAVYGGECNLALYRADYLRQRTACLFSLRNCSKLRAVEAEGFLWKTAPPERRGSYPGLRHQADGIESPYGGAPRQRIHFAGVDLVKYKANWGQRWPPDAVTP